MNKLYIDVTQLVTWQGRLTGIPRVMDEISRRYSQASDDVQLVQWIHPHGFVPATLADKTGATTMDAQPVAAKPGLLRRGVGKAYRSLPAGVRGRVDAARTKPSLPPPPTDLLTLEPGSRLLILWGEWHDDAYTRYLTENHKRGIKLVQVAYDMLPLVTPQFSGHATAVLEAYVRAVYPLCERLIAISRHTSHDVTVWMKEHDLHVPPISIIRLGEDFAISSPKRPAALSKLGKAPFLLCVGTVEIRKNHQLLYYAYKLAASRGLELPPVVIVGRRGWMTEQTYELMSKDPQVRDSFLFLHDASDEELSWLYDNCQATIYPSFYEGWGLPVAESVVRGVPCLASRTSSIPEVAGDLIAYFDPASPEECVKRIIDVQDKQKLAAMRQALRAYVPTSWDATFEQVRKAIGEV